MSSPKKIERQMAYILIAGICMAMIFIILGAAIYLYQHGQDAFTIYAQPYPLTLQKFDYAHFSDSPLTLIEFGLMCLVLMQVLRICLLVLFYIHQRDLWFIGFSLFILSILIYSLAWRTL